MRTRAVAIAVGAAVLALPIALRAARPAGHVRIPPAKRAEFAHVGVPSGARVMKPFAIAGAAEPRWRSGVVESGLAPFPESMYVIANQWQAVVAGRHVNVYAGSLGFDLRQGVLVVAETGVGRVKTGRPVAYRAPGRTGALRITRARGMTLELRSPRGAVYVFDVRRRMLVRVSRGGE